MRTLFWLDPFHNGVFTYPSRGPTMVVLGSQMFTAPFISPTVAAWAGCARPYLGRSPIGSHAVRGHGDTGARRSPGLRCQIWRLKFSVSSSVRSRRLYGLTGSPTFLAK